MSIIRGRDLIASEFEEKINKLNRVLGQEKDTSVRRAIISERTRVLKAKAELLARKSIELRDFQKEQGRDAPGRAEDLRHGWWNDEEADPVRALRCSRDSCHVEPKNLSRMASPFDDHEC